MTELVSIIVPVYRARVYIAETIAMVIRQTYKEWELLLIEDCSPDNSAEIIRNILENYTCRNLLVGWQNERLAGQDCSAWQQGIRSAEEYTDGTGRRIVLVCKEKNEGAAAARNTGLSVAQGRYISFLDADDVCFPE